MPFQVTGMQVFFHFSIRAHICNIATCLLQNHSTYWSYDDFLMIGNIFKCPQNSFRFATEGYGSRLISYILKRFVTSFLIIIVIISQKKCPGNPEFQLKKNIVKTLFYLIKFWKCMPQIHFLGFYLLGPPCKICWLCTVVNLLFFVLNFFGSLLV